MGTIEVYLTAKQARERFRMSEAGHRAAVNRGDFPSPVIIGGKRLWSQSRLEAFERDLHADAARRELQAKLATGTKLPEVAEDTATDEDPFAPAEGPEADDKPTPSLKARMGRPVGAKNRPRATTGTAAGSKVPHPFARAGSMPLESVRLQTVRQ